MEHAHPARPRGGGPPPRLRGRPHPPPPPFKVQPIPGAQQPVRRPGGPPRQRPPDPVDQRRRRLVEPPDGGRLVDLRHPGDRRPVVAPVAPALAAGGHRPDWAAWIRAAGTSVTLQASTMPFWMILMSA